MNKSLKCLWRLAVSRRRRGAVGSSWLSITMGGSSYQLIHSRLGSTTRKWDCSAAQGAKREEKEFSLVTISVPFAHASILPAVTPIVKPLLKPLTRKISRLAETLPWRDCFVKRPIKPVLGPASRVIDGAVAMMGNRGEEEGAGSS